MITRRHALGALAASSILAADKPYKVELLWKTPEGHPNAMEATSDGLWIAEQESDNAYLLDWKNGKVLQKLETESHNTSGIAYGGGALWMAGNGKSLFRPEKPTDKNGGGIIGEIIKVDPKTGKTLGRYPMPDGGGVHGVVWDNGTLWMTCFKWKSLAQVEPDSFKVLHQIPITYPRAHGLALDGQAIWCVFSTDYLILKLNREDGAILDKIQLVKGTDPDPHGMDIYQGMIHYCDAGMQHPDPKLIETPTSGYICRIRRS